MNRSELDVNILRDRNPLFVQLSSGDIRNGYTVKIMNKTQEEKQYSIEVEGINNYELRVDDVDEFTDNGAPVVTVARDRLRSLKLYIAIPRTELSSDSVDVIFKVRELGSNEQDIQTTSFKGPKS